MLARRSCSFCVGLFSPIRKNHFYCSSTCRKLAHKAKKRKEVEKRLNARLETKLRKLAGSTFGIYLAKELKRAGTAEALKGHTADSLKELAALRRRCTASGGYMKGKPLGTYELSHIYPVSCKKRLGLLHPLNLVICPREYNRKHSRKVPKLGYLGLSIDREDLSRKWCISNTLTNLEVIELAGKFLGIEFRKWLKSHLIQTTQHKQLIKKLAEAGVPEHVTKMMTLEQLKALADEEDIPYFSQEIDAQDLLYILGKELKRFEISKELSLTLDYLSDILGICTFHNPPWKFIGSEQEISVFIEFVCEQTLHAIHGQHFEIHWQERSLLSNFQKVEPRTEPRQSYIDDEIL
jgi:hypothetical protein